MEIHRSQIRKMDDRKMKEGLGEEGSEGEGGGERNISSF